MDKRSRKPILLIALMLLGCAAVYVPWSVLTGRQVLFGWDYGLLHMRRLIFARHAILGGHAIPGWYPHQMLGSPFAANVQNMPWIPSHLVLFLFDPKIDYAIGVFLAAALGAIFTYLFARRLELSPVAAAAAGWTFVCAGPFAARVMTGELSAIEGYCALPLLVWLADARRFVWLAIATACVVCAGHPQLPAYAVGVTILYIAWRRSWRLLWAMALGIGAAMIVWWPMLLLAGRSTRVLPLDPSPGDITLPLHRLWTLLIPGIDGWPAGIRLAAAHPFTGFAPVFWQTFGYAGVLPMVAAAALVVMWALRREKIDSRWIFLATIAMGALICALPWSAALRGAVSATIVRSPARLLYVVVMALALAFGKALDELRRLPMARWMAGAAVALALIAQAWDLGSTARLFVHTVDSYGPSTPRIEATLAREINGGRVAVSIVMGPDLLDRYDDASGYDSIFLADTYRQVLALAGLSPRLNEEILDAAAWPIEALKAAGVRFVITWQERKDLEFVLREQGLNLYRVPAPQPRATAEYSRPSSDEIVLRGSGRVHVLEAFDPGWSAEIEGAPATVVEDGLGMSVEGPTGDHEVRMKYRTPGRGVGAMISLVSLLLLTGWWARSIWNGDTNVAAAR